jgi:hypothetical protein
MTTAAPVRPPSGAGLAGAEPSGGRAAGPEDDVLTLVAVRVPAPALPDAPPGTDLLSRLRMVHRTVLPAARRPVDASWQLLGGRPAVLDRLGDEESARLSAFSLAAALGTDDGLAVVGWAPHDRAEALERVGVPLATLLRPDGDGLVWAQLPGWVHREEVQLTAPGGVRVRASLAPLPPATDAGAWTETVLAGLPRLRGLPARRDHAVSVRGVEQACLQTFDHAEDGGCTVVVTGIAGADGFGLLLELPARGPGSRTDPGTVLALLEVRPARPGRPFAALPTALALPPWPRDDRSGAPVPGATGAEPTAAARPAPPLTPPPAPLPPTPVRTAVEPPARPAGSALPPLPPPPRTARVPGRPRLRGPRDRYLDAAVDRVMVAAIDVADGDPGGPAVPRRRSPGQAPGPADLDAAAVRTVLDAVLMRGWGPPLPWHGRMDVEALAAARVGRWRRIADLLVVETTPPAGTVLDDEVWVTARLVALAAAQARATSGAHAPRGEGDRGLTGVLERVRRGLEDPDGAWDESMATVLVARGPRYRLTTGFDGGAGRLLRPANEAARSRWGPTVDHFDLPVPLALARQVQALLDRARLDRAEPAGGTRPFSQRELVEFREDYLVTLDELRRALGPAYVVEERARRR